MKNIDYINLRRNKYIYTKKNIYCNYYISKQNKLIVQLIIVILCTIFSMVRTTHYHKKIKNKQFSSHNIINLSNKQKLPPQPIDQWHYFNELK